MDPWARSSSWNERRSKAGNIAPDIWMTQATGAPVGAGALLAATDKALARLK